MKSSSPFTRTKTRKTKPIGLVFRVLMLVNGFAESHSHKRVRLWMAPKFSKRFTPCYGGRLWSVQVLLPFFIHCIGMSTNGWLTKCCESSIIKSRDTTVCRIILREVRFAAFRQSPPRPVFLPKTAFFLHWGLKNGLEKIFRSTFRAPIDKHFGGMLYWIWKKRF